MKRGPEEGDKLCSMLVLRRIDESKLNEDSTNARYRCTKLIFLFKINCSLKANIVKCNMTKPSSFSSPLCGEQQFCVKREKKLWKGYMESFTENY